MMFVAVGKNKLLYFHTNKIKYFNIKIFPFEEETFKYFDDAMRHSCFRLVN